MAKQTKKTDTKSKSRKRVEVKGLAKSQEKLTSEGMKKVRGGMKFPPLTPGVGKIAMADPKK